MLNVRLPAVAGAFYPAQRQALTHDVVALLAARPAPADAPSPKAIIVPHAGYIYSGRTAALAYGRLSKLRDSVRRVILLGPVHRVPVRGLALPDATSFATALGEIQVDQEARAAIASMPQVVVSAAAHAQEHSLEVQLPFLQSVLQDFKLLPLAVGDASAAEVAEVLEALWGGTETLIVISSDLSHFLPYAQAQATDRQTVQQIMNFQSVITHQQACGATPVNGLLLAARHHGLTPQLLGLCNSGDSAGDKARVVGYASFAFAEPSVGEILLPIARAAIASALGVKVQAAETAPCLQDLGACFVTLTQRGQLRGCIGSLEARRPLLADVKANAVAAALHDPRFAPLTPAELALTRVEVSVLSPLQEMHFASEADALAQLRPCIDGVVLSFGRHRSTFLPQVWEQLPGAAEFMAQLKRKAGLASDFWDPGVRLQRYGVAKWQEVSPS
ncbi:MAG: AmmeMemoRadiSam system protein B [Comamonadaceae bacterium]